MGIIKKSSAFAALFLGVFATQGHAQQFVTARVPFAFAIRGEQFPAGEYMISRVDISAGVMSIVGVNNKASSFELTTPADGVDPKGSQPVLVFRRHETGYQLSEIWLGGDDGRSLTTSHGRSQHAEADARAALDESTILVAAH